MFTLELLKCSFTKGLAILIGFSVLRGGKALKVSKSLSSGLIFRFFAVERDSFLFLIKFPSDTQALLSQTDATMGLDLRTSINTREAKKLIAEPPT